MPAAPDRSREHTVVTSSIFGATDTSLVLLSCDIDKEIYRKISGAIDTELSGRKSGDKLGAATRHNQAVTNPPWAHQPPIRPGGAPSPFDGPTRSIPRHPPASPPGAHPQASAAVLPPASPPAEPRKRGRGFKAGLICLLVLVVALTGLVGTELYARHRAASVIGDTVKCSVGDTATTSLPVVPPFLWQHLTGTYSAIDIKTAGHNVRQAQGMQLQAEIRDLQQHDNTATIKSVNARLTWSSDGIKQTVKSAIPFLGSLITDVSANPDNDTLKLSSLLATLTVRPRATADGGLTLDIVDATGPGLGETSDLQPLMDAYLSRQTSNLPLGVKAQSVDVTDDGVIAQFAAHDTTVPMSTEECFSAT
ncbi:hypothetical protein B7435_17055 [Mycolicibacterium peregrinum]|nr:hypothetical protein B7435_17055 [Mycolicibacterium peregrinum]